MYLNFFSTPRQHNIKILYIIIMKKTAIQAHKLQHNNSKLNNNNNNNKDANI